MEDPEQRELEQVELSEESLSTEVVSEVRESSVMDMATGEENFEGNMSYLVGVLQLPLETLQSVAASEEGMSVLTKVWKCLDEKNSDNSLNIAVESREQLLCKLLVVSFAGVLYIECVLCACS